MKNTFKVTVPIDKKRIVYLFISACEGGSNYWCESLTPKGRGDPYEAMLAGFSLVDLFTKKTHKVTPEDIKEALELFAAKAPLGFADFMSDNDDATTADVFLQLCVFKEVVYG